MTIFALEMKRIISILFLLAAISLFKCVSPQLYSSFIHNTSTNAELASNYSFKSFNLTSRITGDFIAEQTDENEDNHNDEVVCHLDFHSLAFFSHINEIAFIKTTVFPPVISKTCITDFLRI